MIFSENRFTPRIKSGAGCFGIMLRYPLRHLRCGHFYRSEIT